MTYVVVTDSEFDDVSVEERILAPAGVAVVGAHTRDVDTIVRCAEGARALLVGLAPVTGALLDRLPKVELVVRYGVGVDNVDLEAATARGVAVCNVVDYGTEEVAAHAAALTLATWRHVPILDRAVRAGEWNYTSAGVIPRLSESTLGLVGFGRIGRDTAAGLAPWFGSVIAADPYAPADGWPGNVARVEIDEVFERADAISLHLPLSDETRHIVDARRLATVRPTTVLVNTARGGLVDVDALHAALEEGRLRAAGLDVLPEEPPAADHPILRHPRVTLTPHMGWYSEVAGVDLRRIAAEQVAAWFSGQRPRWQISGPPPRDPVSRRDPIVSGTHVDSEERT
ncbi:C-terminal binding protein [Spiractinospora alimapuensis]|uniref:C-terminal binding protein n=1 Tax=Spiractinospora alimapuensis TaxID=2820884 RepID=UPI001F42994B|nr:C-terminal binding protein [Spiractinospora alimapuensis]QVQ50084.1 C-terminal binding protein [Spiractinospora alimapuensis]